MLKKIRTITKQKGQGIVEYALLLAFVVGIAMMLNGADLGGAVKNVFDGVAKALDGDSVALSPEETDKKKILKIGETLKNNFAFSTNQDGKMVLPGNYICVYVTGDGTADIHVQGKSGNQGWYYLNSNLFNESEKNYYDSVLRDLNLSDKSNWAPSYTEADSQWKNGYAVMYGKNGTVTYWNMADSLNSVNFRNRDPDPVTGAGVDKNDLYKAVTNGWGATQSGLHTRITGIGD